MCKGPPRRNFGEISDCDEYDHIAIYYILFLISLVAIGGNIIVGDSGQMPNILSDHHHQHIREH